MVSSSTIGFSTGISAPSLSGPVDDSAAEMKTLPAERTSEQEVERHYPTEFVVMGKSMTRYDRNFRESGHGIAGLLSEIREMCAVFIEVFSPYKMAFAAATPVPGTAASSIINGVVFAVSDEKSNPLKWDEIYRLYGHEFLHDSRKCAAVNARITNEDKRILEKLAEESGQTITEVLRLAIRVLRDVVKRS